MTHATEIRRPDAPGPEPQPPERMLGEFDETIHSLGTLLASVRALQEQHAAETEALREEVRRMRAREADLAQALVRLRNSLAADADRMLGGSVQDGIAGLQAGADQLKARAEAGAEHARIADRQRREAEDALDQANTSIANLEARLADLQDRLDATAAERDDLKTRLDEHERRLDEAGLEIEWRPTRRRTSR